MSTATHYFKIGLFVIIAVIIGIVTVVILGAGSLFQKTITMETYIDGSVQGLSIGAPVKFRGVQIGKVTQIAVVSWEYNTHLSYILVRSSIPADKNWFKNVETTEKYFKREAAKGLRVRLATPGVTGTAFLEVDYLDPRRNPPLKHNWRPEYPYLPSAPSYITQISDSLARIMTSLEDINILGITSRLERTLDTMTNTLESANIEWISKEAHQLLAELRETNKHLDQIIVGRDIEDLVADARSTVAGARRIVETSEKPIQQFLGSLKQTTKSVNSLAGKLDSTSTHLPEAMAQLRVSLRRLDNLLSLPQADLEETLENIRLISENLKKLTEESRRYPSYILFGKPPTHIKPGAKP